MNCNRIKKADVGHSICWISTTVVRDKSDEKMVTVEQLNRRDRNQTALADDSIKLFLSAFFQVEGIHESMATLQKTSV